MITIEKGDLLEKFRNGDIDVLFHGANCFNTMGAGFAKALKSIYPQAYAVDLTTTKGDPKKLGTYTKFKTLNGQFILNAYTQFYYGRATNTTYLNMEALEKVLDNILQDFGGLNLVFGCPMIGCGLAGGNPQKVYDLLKLKFESKQEILKIVNLEIPKVKV